MVDIHYVWKIEEIKLSLVAHRICMYEGDRHSKKNIFTHGSIIFFFFAMIATFKTGIFCHQNLHFTFQINKHFIFYHKRMKTTNCMDNREHEISTTASISAVYKDVWKNKTCINRWQYTCTVLIIQKVIV